MDRVMDDVFCECCSHGDKEERMIFCDSCAKAFHIDCIGLNEVPAGDWLCASESCQRKLIHITFHKNKGSYAVCTFLPLTESNEISGEAPVQEHVAWEGPSSAFEAALVADLALLWASVSVPEDVPTHHAFNYSMSSLFEALQQKKLLNELRGCSDLDAFRALISEWLEAGVVDQLAGWLPPAEVVGGSPPQSGGTPVRLLSQHQLSQQQQLAGPPHAEEPKREEHMEEDAPVVPAPAGLPALPAGSLSNVEAMDEAIEGLRNLNMPPVVSEEGSDASASREPSPAPADEAPPPAPEEQVVQEGQQQGQHQAQPAVQEAVQAPAQEPLLQPRWSEELKEALRTGDAWVLMDSLSPVLKRVQPEVAAEFDSEFYEQSPLRRRVAYESIERVARLGDMTRVERVVRSLVAEMQRQGAA